MERVCFRLQVRKDRMAEYVERHKAVWPEMLQALRETGWTNYSIYLDPSDGLLIGYLETPDLEAAKAGMAAREINTKWQADMAPFFEALDGQAPDEGFLRLQEIFYLA
jgi:L-rhamnose mutarotase